MHFLFTDVGGDESDKDSDFTPGDDGGLPDNDVTLHRSPVQESEALIPAQILPENMAVIFEPVRPENAAVIVEPVFPENVTALSEKTYQDDAEDGSADRLCDELRYGIFTL